MTREERCPEMNRAPPLIASAMFSGGGKLNFITNKIKKHSRSLSN
jgi:hypothetical protein